ncbi:type IV pilin [Halobacteriaceae archaeon GCM10025711]
MNWNTHRPGEERGVSPAIGVILMIAITVILAAVIGAFFLELGNGLTQQIPKASLQTDTSNGNITLEHAGGDPLQAEQTHIIVTNTSSTGESVTFEAVNGTGTLSVGETATIDTSGPAVSGGWSYSSGDGSFSLTTGHTYEVKVIDTASQQVVASPTVTA